MPKKSSFIIIALVSAMLSCLSSCSSDEDKASKIISGLLDSDCVISTNMIGESKNIITSELQKDSTIIVRVYDITANKSDSIISFLKGTKVWEAIPLGADNYLVVSSLPRKDGNDHHLFYAYILRNVQNPKTSSTIQLFIDEGNKNLAATGYTIDSEERKLTLSSFDYDSSSTTILHTVYDFDGHKILSDPLKIEFKAQNTGGESTGGKSTGGTYIWECQYCHEKRNAKNKPSSFEFTCHGRGEAQGFGNSHKWVKIGRVD
ncbi:MAG: hypothetical protein K2H58_09350 [Paramuribaculum sp.]|nr:hypothetical protein [Paramuribaculum sp.]